MLGVRNKFARSLLSNLGFVQKRFLEQMGGFNALETDICVLGKGKTVIDPFAEETVPNNIGDDSFFVVLNSPTRVTLGVADGVGGWTEEKGGRPDLVAQTLMKHCGTVTREYFNKILNPYSASQVILSQAYERLQANPPGLGSTTALVAVSSTSYDQIHFQN